MAQYQLGHLSMDKSMLSVPAIQAIPLHHFFQTYDLTECTWTWLDPSHPARVTPTCITRWPEAVPIPTITAETVADAFVACWVSRFSVPSTIMTDRGSQFESALWDHLMQLLGVKRIRTTHSQWTSRAASSPT